MSTKNETEFMLWANELMRGEPPSPGQLEELRAEWECLQDEAEYQQEEHNNWFARLFGKKEE